MSKRLDVLMKKFNGTCHYCHCKVISIPHRSRKPMPDNQATTDHLVPRALGGGDELENLRLACFKCNNGKSNIENFYTLAKRYGWTHRKFLGWRFLYQRAA